MCWLKFDKGSFNHAIALLLNNYLFGYNKKLDKTKKKLEKTERL